MYKINIIVLLGLSLGYINTLHAAQPSSPLKPQKKPTASVVRNSATIHQPLYIDWHCETTKKCDAIKIVQSGLERWHLLHKTGKLASILDYYAKANNYNKLIGAYHHLLDRHLNRRDRKSTNHKDRYIYINRIMCEQVDCDFKRCPCYARNQRTRAHEDPQNDVPPEFILVRDLMDTMHVYFVHGYDSAHRYLPPKEMPYTADLEDKCDLFDQALYHLTTWQAKAKQQIRLLDRSHKYQTKMLPYVPPKKTEKDHLKTGAYGFGVRLYYWNYYKDNGDEDATYNAGHTYQSLYVAPVCSSFKDEILAKKQYIGIAQWQQKFFEAGVILAQSPTLRKLSSLDIRYDIREQAGLTVEHLLAILFYTHFTKLSADFSASCRYQSHEDTIEDVKKRNAEWHYLAKHLREVVELFGRSIGMDAKYKKVYEGSFYHGISHALFHEFNAHCYGPISTSKRLEVATLFTNKDNGLILELKEGTGYQDKRLRYFNVSLLSCFAVEDEKLFMGGYTPLRIASICLLKDRINTAPLIETLFLMDKMLKGEPRFDGYKPSFKGITLLKKALTASSDLPAYIKKTWDEFTLRKHRIDIHIRNMHEDYSDFKPLFFASTKQYQNLPQVDKIVKIFPNLIHLVCEQMDCIGTTHFDYGSTVISSAFVCALKDLLAQLHYDIKLKTIILKTLRHKIDERCKLYGDEFENLGWQIEKKCQRIVLKKKPYYLLCTDTMEKVMAAVRGERFARPITPLDIAIVNKLMTHDKSIPADVQKEWNLFSQEQQHVKINIGSMHDSCKLLLPLFVSPNHEAKNVLCFDQIAKIFPNVTQITCKEADYDGDKKNQYGQNGDYSSAIVNSDYMLGLYSALNKLEEQQWHKVEKVITTTLEYSIKAKCSPYTQKFNTTGWYIGKGANMLMVTKHPYDDCIGKISTMICGGMPTYEATTLDAFIFNKFICGAKDIPPRIKKIWDGFRKKQNKIVINVQQMYKNYAPFVTILFSEEPKYKNLLRFGKLVCIFPSIEKIICEATDNTTGGYLPQDSSDAILGDTFIIGLKDSLHKLIAYKWNQLREVTIKAYHYEIKCNLFETAFGEIGWKIEKRKLAAEDNYCMPQAYHPLHDKCATILISKKKDYK